MPPSLRRPRLTGKRLAIAKSATRKVFAHFHDNYADMARFLGVRRQVVRAWANRGYVSAPAALRFDELGIEGAARGQLRPDVYDWTAVRKYRYAHTSLRRAQRA